MSSSANPLIIQSDFTLLLEVHHEKFEEARNGLSKFAELIKSPEHIHTYQLSSLSLWNAAAAGNNIQDVIDFLYEYSKYDVPQNVISEIRLIYNRFGLVEIHKYKNDSQKLLIYIKDPNIEKEILSNPRLKKFLQGKVVEQKYTINLLSRGDLKVEFFNFNIPVHDIAGYTEGKRLDIKLRDTTLSNKMFNMRDYQQMASEAFYQAGSNLGGHGIIVLPCGAGKTIVGMDIMSKVKSYTLILTTSVAAVHQWINEILDKTELTRDQIGEYTGDNKEIKPITVCTYQILVYRKTKESDFKHFEIFKSQEWGLIIYDEVHLLPAPVFKITSEIQSTRRLGLTATLVREDKKENDVFCLIGPKKFDTPWKVLEKQGWIAEARCSEIKLPLSKNLLMEYLVADQKEKYNIAAKNPIKLEVLKDILIRHKGQLTLIIGHFISQIEKIAKLLNTPKITLLSFLFVK